MKAYLEIVKKILKEGVFKKNRTGVDAQTVVGATFEHDMSEGFPLLTTKRMTFHHIAVELECFIKGITDKEWLKSNGCYIWNEWANPKKAPYGHDESSKKRMVLERDLGPIYGFQWRHFGAEYDNYDSDYSEKGTDQLKNLVNKLKTDPSDRRMIVSAWNPSQLGQQALPPCHYGFQVTVLDGKLNLLWNQRSVDTMLGLPYNIASYGLLLHLLAKEVNLKEGKLIGFLADTHIYANHIEGAIEQCGRGPLTLPTISTKMEEGIFNWSSKAFNWSIANYNPMSKIYFPIAV